MKEHSYVVIGFLNASELNTLNRLLPIGLIKLNKNLEVIYVNEHSQTILGLSFDEILNRNWMDILNASSYEQLIDVFQKNTAMKNSLKEIIHIVSPLGRKRTLSLQVISNHVSTNIIDNYISYYVILMDITQEHNANEKVKYLATHDKLTDLMTRDMLLEDIKAHYYQGDIESCGLLFLDLDGFKEINDTLGHSYGDEVLKIVARKIERNIKSRDTAARFGGDEFVILYSNVEDDMMRSLANNMASKINQTVVIEGKDVSISASIGFSCGKNILKYLKDDLNADLITEEWIKMVDVAMYESKRNKHSKVTFFDEKIHKKHLEIAKKELFLKSVLEKKAVEIFFQPIFKNEKIFSIEALARFEEYNVEEMLDVALFNSKKLDLVYLLFEKGLESFKLFLDATSRDDIFLNINITVEMLSDVDFYKNCITQCKNFGLKSENIYLEITEEAIENEKAVFGDNIQRLMEYGFKFSLDDYGTGYSSINKLIDYNFTQIKLDRVLVKNIQRNPKQQKALEISVELGNSLEMEVLLEGIENEAENTYADKLNITFKQGYFQQRPQNLNDTIKYIKGEK